MSANAAFFISPHVPHRKPSSLVLLVHPDHFRRRTPHPNSLQPWQAAEDTKFLNPATADLISSLLCVHELPTTVPKLGDRRGPTQSAEARHNVSRGAQQSSNVARQYGRTTTAAVWTFAV
jgi:hypothetical protein